MNINELYGKNVIAIHQEVYDKDLDEVAANNISYEDDSDEIMKEKYNY